MRIVLNSDVLHTEKLGSVGLPGHIERFCRDVAAAGALLVLPRTTLLEHQRNQERLEQGVIAKIEAAIQLLTYHGVALPEINAQELVPRNDFVSALRATGVQVEVESPKLEDYQNAERRACLHLSPQPPETKYDEMRDLVIWEVALRVAKRDGKAILVSRDDVHGHERGGAEAEACGLLRVQSLDEALDTIGKESPVGRLTRDILDRIWEELRAEGLPLAQTVSIHRVTNVSFVSDAAGTATSATFDLVTTIPTGFLSGSFEVVQTSAGEIRAQLADIRENGTLWRKPELTITVRGQLPVIAKPEADRINELRTLLRSGG